MKALEEHPPPDFVPDRLQHFSAQVAKWRYETIPATMKVLLPLRPLCEKYVREEWFADVKDKESLKEFFDACHDPFLWKFMDATYREVFEPTEADRHFGMICNCAEHVRQRHEDRVKHISCWRNGRRFAEAASYYKTAAADRLARSRTIRCDECENDAEVWHLVKFCFCNACTHSSRNASNILIAPPWTAVKCDEVAGASRFFGTGARAPAGAP